MPTLITLINFNFDSGSTADLITDPAGDLFGTTFEGGANGGGSVIEIVKTDGYFAGTPTTLVSFNGTNGDLLFPGVIANSEKNLFGTTDAGGVGDNGTVFEVPYIDRSYASTPTTLVSFNASYSGYKGAGGGSVGGLVADAAGNLFGTTVGGGKNQDGTVFEIAKTNGSYANTPTTLVSFDGSNGKAPRGSLMLDQSGNLFGTTSFGTVFEIVKTDGSHASTPITLANIDGPSWGGLVTDAAGDLFGTTVDGGSSLNGTVFEIPHIDGSYANTPITLASFNGSNGDEVYGTRSSMLPGTCSARLLPVERSAMARCSKSSRPAAAMPPRRPRSSALTAPTGQARRPVSWRMQPGICRHTRLGGQWRWYVVRTDQRRISGYLLPRRHPDRHALG